MKELNSVLDPFPTIGRSLKVLQIHYLNMFRVISVPFPFCRKILRLCCCGGLGWSCSAFSNVQHTKVKFIEAIYDMID